MREEEIDALKVTLSSAKKKVVEDYKGSSSFKNALGKAVTDFKASAECQELISHGIEEWKSGADFAVMEIT